MSQRNDSPPGTLLVLPTEPPRSQVRRLLRAGRAHNATAKTKKLDANFDVMAFSVVCLFAVPVFLSQNGPCRTCTYSIPVMTRRDWHPVASLCFSCPACGRWRHFMLSMNKYCHLSIQISYFLRLYSYVGRGKEYCYITFVSLSTSCEAV